MRAGRTGSAEGEAGELQPGRSLLGDIADDVQRVGLALGVLVLVENLEAVVDGADGIDHVVADLAGDQRGKLEIGRLRGVRSSAHVPSSARSDRSSTADSATASGTREKRQISSCRRDRPLLAPRANTLIHAAPCTAKRPSAPITTGQVAV